MRARRERLGYLLMGVSLGGLIDGIVLHQILRWHHLWSARNPDRTPDGLDEHILVDGVFHAATIVVLLLGIALAVERPLDPRPLVGMGLIGWGTFNLFDHLVFHLALRAHHIRMDVDDPHLYDWTFAAIGLALIMMGVLIVRRIGTSATTRSARSRTGAPR